MPVELFAFPIAFCVTLFIFSVARKKLDEEKRKIREITTLAKNNRIAWEAYHQSLNDEMTNESDCDDTPGIVTRLNGKTVHSSISISADGIRIEGDCINIAKFIPDYNPHEIITKHSNQHSVTNCPNCGAAFSSSMFCEFCGTKKS